MLSTAIFFTLLVQHKVPTHFINYSTLKPTLIHTDSQVKTRKIPFNEKAFTQTYEDFKYHKNNYYELQCKLESIQRFKDLYLHGAHFPQDVVTLIHSEPEIKLRLKEEEQLCQAFMYQLNNFNLVGVQLPFGIFNKICLSGADLQNSYLVGAYFSDADLSFVDLTKAKMQKIRLISTNLDHAILAYADLVDAELIEASLKGAILTNADLSCASLLSADLTCAILNYADIQHALLLFANMTRVVMRGTQLNESNLGYANLSDAHLFNANLRNACLTHVNLNNASLFNVILARANLSFANLTGITMQTCDVTGANFYNCVGLSEEQKKYLRSHGALDVPE
jgi:uncharacterized protein YjbI with pentapeptide repeats